MYAPSANIVTAVSVVIAVLLVVIALVGKEMVQAPLAGVKNVFHMGLWESCINGTDSSGNHEQRCQDIEDKAAGYDLLKVARPIAGISLAVLVVGMVLALLGAQTEKKGLYVLLLILFAVAALGMWVSVVLVVLFVGKNKGSKLGASWITYTVAAGLVTLGAVSSGFGAKNAVAAQL